VTVSRTIRLVLLASVLLAAFFRCWGLGAIGFAEDEIDITRAVDAYRHLDFSANAEHPMLAKLAAFGAVEAASGWNALAEGTRLPRVSPEVAIRFPSAFTGGVLTTIVLFLLCGELFPDIRIAAWAGLLWALDVNATAVNRTAKEDTFFLFFLLAAAWLYARAKRTGREDPRGAQRWYSASAVGFGLMLACKYMPHYYGLHALFVRITDPAPGANKPGKWRWHAAMGAAFLATNFALFLPASWARLSQYLGGNTPIHTGYAFAHTLYVNSVLVTPGGVPPSFYLAFLALKVPVLILTAFAAGLVLMIRRRGERGFVFARIFLIFFLLPYSLMGGKFVRYMLPLLALVDILAAAGIVWLLDAARARVRVADRRWLAPALTALLVAAPLYAQLSARPFFGLSQNALGAALTEPGYMFADDEFNDAGVREAVAAIARVAPPGDAIVSDASLVVEEYLRELGRTDLQALSLSRDGMPRPLRETWVIAQDGHVYFENQLVLEHIRSTMAPWAEWTAGGAVAVQVYLIAPSGLESKDRPDWGGWPRPALAAGRTDVW
jgi:4-amino-4-deoxy-L-arabinose transferase-like glycosyltransferase